MSIRVSKREFEHHPVFDLEPEPAGRAAATCYELYVDLVYHLTASPESYEEPIIDAAPDERGPSGVNPLMEKYPNVLTLLARDVVVYSLQACEFNELPEDSDSYGWRQLEEQINRSLTRAALRDVADADWLNDPRGAPNPFHNPASIKQIYREDQPKPLDELLGSRSLHPDVIAYLDAKKQEPR